MKTGPGPAEPLRAEMVEEIVRSRAHLGAPLPPAVEGALRVLPREHFLPGLALEEVYADQAVVTKRGADGIALSAVSNPTIVAMMLQRAGLAEGMRVLEVGSGGYNAALIAELVGTGGAVTSIDIDTEVVETAARCLEEAGYGKRVVVAKADGEYGYAEHAPYDRILVTAGAWDLPPAWGDQLASGGRVVVPMRIRGLTRCLTLEPENGHWISRAQDMCGFVRFQGAGAHWEAMPLLHEEAGSQVGLRLENGPEVDTAALRRALTCSPFHVWSEVTVVWDEPTDEMDVWLATANDDFALLTADPGAVESGLVNPTWRLGTPTLLDPVSGGFAYRTLRRAEEAGRWEFGAIGHGPNAAELAERLCAQMRAWDHEQRHGAGPQFRLYPATTPDDRLHPGRVVDKHHTRMVISWPVPQKERKA